MHSAHLPGEDGVSFYLPSGEGIHSLWYTGWRCHNYLIPANYCQGWPGHGETLFSRDPKLSSLHGNGTIFFFLQIQDKCVPLNNQKNSQSWFFLDKQSNSCVTAWGKGTTLPEPIWPSQHLPSPGIQPTLAGVGHHTAHDVVFACEVVSQQGASSQKHQARDPSKWFSPISLSFYVSILISEASRERQIGRMPTCWFTPPNAHNSWELAEGKPGVGNSIQASCVDARDLTT